MDRVQLLTQAYSQAPWRKQLQFILSFLLALVTIAIVAGIYLNVTTRTIAYGREIQWMRVLPGGVRPIDEDLEAEENEIVPIEVLQQKVTSLEAELARLTSFSLMEERAQRLGFRPAETEEILYIEVAGYPGRQTAVLAPPPAATVTGAAVSSVAFKESLVDWLKEQIIVLSAEFKRSLP